MKTEVAYTSKTFMLNMVVEWFTLLLHIQEVVCSIFHSLGACAGIVL